MRRGFLVGVFLGVLIGLLCGGALAFADSLMSPAPVTSVNGAQGAVTVPTTQRQASVALDATSGTVSWPFPTAFTNSPTCYESLVATAAGYSFDDPIVTSISVSAVTVKVTAHPTSLSITSVLNLPLALPLTVNPPAGTTITLTCTAPL